MKEWLRKNNQGASLITVIITISFLAIMGTMVLSSAVVTYQMKSLDARSKKDFYSVETTLNDIYNGLGKDMTLIIADGYESTLTSRNPDTGLAFETETEAFAYFKKYFVDKFKELYGVSGTTVDPVEIAALIVKLNEYIVQPSDGSAEIKSLQRIEVASSNAYIKLIGAIVTYDNTVMQTTSSITTDIVLSAPTIRFFDSHDYVWDYAVIGNEGVTVTGTNNSVNGNLYAGIAGDPEGGLVLEDAIFNLSGETIVTSGNITLKDSSLSIQGLTNAMKSNIWAGTISLESGENHFRAYSNTYLDDDLEILSSNSTVTLEGSYYGYNNSSGLPTAGVVGHTSSSAINVNGKNNTLNFTGLDLLLLAGKSYLDFDSAGYDGTDSGLNEYATGEGLALRTNQVIYMVPTQFLPVANPELASRVGSNNYEHIDSIEESIKDWFGYSYLNEEYPVRQETVIQGGERYVYFFLNFKNDKIAADYVNEILTATSGSAYLMRLWIEDRVENLLGGELTINDGTGECKVYANFEVMQYTSSGALIGTTKNNSTIIDANLYSTALLSRYDYIWKTLDPLHEEPLEQYIPTYSGTSAGLPLAKFVNTSDDGFAIISHGQPDGYFEKTVGTSGYTVIIGNGAIELKNKNINGVVLVLGDVLVENCTINGLVMSNSEITIKNSTITANRDIIQSIIEQELLEIDLKGYTIADEEHKEYFVHYLTDPRYNGDYVYGSESVGTDYTQFITYENWRKGDLG